MQLTSTTDYAIRLICFLAYKEDPCPAASIATSTFIPNNYISKIIKKLKINGIVGSTEGIQGGYYLLRKPEDITLREILETTENTMKINRCLENDAYCSNNVAAVCCVHKVFQRFQEEFETKLEEVTVAELVGREKPHHFGNAYVILQIDLRTGLYTRLYAHDAKIRSHIEPSGDYRTFINDYIKTYVIEDDQARVEEVSLLEELAKNAKGDRWEKQIRFRQRKRSNKKGYIWMVIHQYYDSEDNTAILILHNSVLMEQRMSTIEVELQNKNSEIEQNYWNIVYLLGQVLDNHYGMEGNNARSLVHYTELIYRKLSELYPELNITETEILNVSHLAPIHDIGKIRIPKEIINKSGDLTEKERNIMQSHSQLGADMVTRFPKDNTLEYLNQFSYDICLYHHERYDGSGYPQGLSGDDIPLCAQVVGLADVYDALVSQRKYKSSIEHEKAVQMILSGNCGNFSEQLLHSFLVAAMQPEWKMENTKEKEDE